MTGQQTEKIAETRARLVQQATSGVSSLPSARGPRRGHSFAAPRRRRGCRRCSRCGLTCPSAGASPRAVGRAGLPVKTRSAKGAPREPDGARGEAGDAVEDAPWRPLAFSAGNPRAEIIHGELHLFRDTLTAAASSSGPTGDVGVDADALPRGRHATVCVLAVPSSPPARDGGAAASPRSRPRWWRCAWSRRAGRTLTKERRRRTTRRRRAGRVAPAQRVSRGPGSSSVTAPRTRRARTRSRVTTTTASSTRSAKRSAACCSCGAWR